MLSTGCAIPQPIADFPDHYIRNEEIIRPKPRRLVDMRRLGIGNEQAFPHENSNRILQMPFQPPHTVQSSGKSPPILPVKPTSHLQLKPLPLPPPNSNNFHYTKRHGLMTSPSSINDPGTHPCPGQSPSHPRDFAQPQQAQYHNSAAMMLNLSRQNQSSLTPQYFNPIQNSNSAPPNFNQRSHPNLPRSDLLEQRRLFLSPQPSELNPYNGHQMRRGMNHSSCDTRAQYYEDIPTKVKDTRPRSTGVHGDWKSVENLPKSFSTPPRLAIQIPLVSPFRNDTSNCTKNLYQPPTNFGQELSISSQDLRDDGGFPEYDRIRTPPELNSAYVEHTPPPKSINFTKPCPSFQTKDNSVQIGNLTPSSRYEDEMVASRNDSANFGNKVSESIGFHPIHDNHAHLNSESSTISGSTPLAPSSQPQQKFNNNQEPAAAPSSKLKSRRRNILQHLSIEEMRTLGHGGGSDLGPRTLGSNNTGTGGSSSSEASSGHASMSDSQTSGSPPAPADYSKINPANTPLSGANFKSVLKSVPEDESSSRNFLNEKSINGDSGNRSTGSSQNSGGKIKGSKSRHHRTKDSLLLGNGSSGLEDIKQAIEQLTLRSYHSGSSVGVHGVVSEGRSNGIGGVKGQSSRGDHHSSYSTSTYSSMSGSECERQQRKTNHMLRHSSLETINTQVTSADEFVWVDSHNRLVELQNFPWSNHDILKVIERSSRLRESLERISMETVPRISYLLQRAFVRIAREAQRLSKPYGFCTKQEISSAFRIVLSPSMADSCIKACLRAAAMFSVSTNEPLHRESKSIRAGVNLHVGKFQRWMVEVRLGRYVHEFAAIHLTSGIENLIEEILGQALRFITTGAGNDGDGPGNHQPILTAALLEKSIANNGDLWGLLQPFAHLNAGRTASGALALPRWASIVSMDSSESSCTTIGAGNQEDFNDSLFIQRSAIHYNKSLEQSILTTCVGSIGELTEILSKVSQFHSKQVPISNGNKNITPAWSSAAIQTLFYFMRCSQLESDDEVGSNNLASSTATLGEHTIDRQQVHHTESAPNPIQELVYERPFIVLPPLIEWVRVVSAHTEHRHSLLIDRDDVMQGARLLLPGIDCPVRLIGYPDEVFFPRRPIDEFECNRRLKIDLGFKILSSGRSDLIAQALLLMPQGSKANTFNENGLSPLILACLRGEERMVRHLLEAGADPDAETPANGSNYPYANNEVQHWTALTFAALIGNISIAKILLERGGNVEGGAKLSEEKSTQTPLQVASATGNLEIISILLNYGASPYLSTLVRDSVCYMGSASRGSFSAISVAAAHGQRTVLHKLLSHPLHSSPSSKEVLSLEEILAEGGPSSPSGRNPRPFIEDPKQLTKSQMKVLQEAMYQSAESGHLEITLDFRTLGIPWTLHCWVNALSTAHDLRCDPVIGQLLQDFLQILPNEDFTQAQFVDECLPLLFTIFRNSKIKNEGTTLLLADIFQTCYGRELPIKEIRDTMLSNGTRIDPKYVNNPELSDVQFRVEGKVFYAHKIVLVTSSPRFKAMLKSAPESNPPILQINDTRYHIFQMLMEYLYNGACDVFRMTEQEDMLELMAAANFFQLDGLLRFCETKCSQLVNTESVVSLYIHAKVYNAVQLLEYCQGFMLQNMVQLITFDDSARKLIFGKRLHNHDVLAGLLLTLQARLKAKPNISMSSCQISSAHHPFPTRKYK